MSYTVTLQDFPEIPDNIRVQAERRFIRTLERAIGSEEDVVSAYSAWSNAEDAGEGELSGEEAALAKRWVQAATRAQQDAFNGLGEAQEAYFEFRVAR